MRGPPSIEPDPDGATSNGCDEPNPPVRLRASEGRLTAHFPPCHHPGEGLLSEPTAVAQLVRRELVILPHSVTNPARGCSARSHTLCGPPVGVASLCATPTNIVTRLFLPPRSEDYVRAPADARAAWVARLRPR